MSGTVEMLGRCVGQGDCDIGEVRRYESLLELSTDQRLTTVLERSDWTGDNISSAPDEISQRMESSNLSMNVSPSICPQD